MSYSLPPPVNTTTKSVRNTPRSTRYSTLTGPINFGNLLVNTNSLNISQHKSLNSANSAVTTGASPSPIMRRATSTALLLPSKMAPSRSMSALYV